ncbi:MAG: hypothetical protein ABEI52_03430, partial [Halobacteriaceae archaeon]
MPLKEYDAIRLRDEIQGTLGNRDAIEQGHRRTPDRDKVAQYIVENVIQKGRWPMNMTDLAEETEYSRQLVSEVVSDYFEGVDDNDQPSIPRQSDSPMTASPPIENDGGSGGQPDSLWVLVDGSYRQLEINVPDDV